MIWRRSAADLPTRPLAASHGRRHHPHSATYGTVLAAFSTSRPTCQVPVPPQLPVRRAPRKEPQCSSRRCPRRGVVPAAGRHVSASRQDRDPHVERQVVFLPAVGLDGLLGIHSRGRRVWPQRRPRGCVPAPLTQEGRHRIRSHRGTGRGADTTFATAPTTQGSRSLKTRATSVVVVVPDICLVRAWPCPPGGGRRTCRIASPRRGPGLFYGAFTNCSGVSGTFSVTASLRCHSATAVTAIQTSQAPMPTRSSRPM